MSKNVIYTKLKKPKYVSKKVKISNKAKSDKK